MIALDRAAFLWVVAHRVDALDGPMWMLSAVGRAGLIWLAIGLVLFVLHRLRRRDFLQYALALAVTFLVADRITKPIVNRERPFIAIPAVQVIGGPPAGASFPSGHAASSVAAAWTLARLAPAGTIVWWSLTLGIACSRVYLGVHYPLDVVGGTIIGLACAALVDVWVRARSPAPLQS